MSHELPVKTLVPDDPDTQYLTELACSKMREYRSLRDQGSRKASEARREYNAAMIRLSRKVFGQTTDYADEAEKLAQLELAAHTDTGEEDRVRIVRQALGEFAPTLLPAQVQFPDPEIRLANDRTGSLLSIGEPLAITGLPKAGKSTFSLQLAVKATGGKPGSRVNHMGISVRVSPWILASYEDSPFRMRQRASQLGFTGSDALFFVPMKARPLWQTRDTGTGSGPSPWFARFWDEVGLAARDARRKLGITEGGVLLLDPLAAAFDAGETASPARQFIQSMNEEAKTKGLAFCAVAHSGKGGDRGVSGSVQWNATFRAILHIERDDDNNAFLSVPMANYSAPVDTIKI